MRCDDIPGLRFYDKRVVVDVKFDKNLPAKNPNKNFRHKYNSLSGGKSSLPASAIETGLSELSTYVRVVPRYNVSHTTRKYTYTLYTLKCLGAKDARMKPASETIVLYALHKGICSRVVIVRSFDSPAKHPKCIRSDPVNIETRKAATRNAGNVTDKLKAGIKGVITRSQKAESATGKSSDNECETHM